MIMSRSTGASRAICRITACLLVLVGSLALVVAIALWPSVLTRVLVDGGISSFAGRVASGLLAVLMAGAGVVTIVSAARLWVHAARLPARQVHFSGAALCFAAGIALAGVELVVRIAVPPDAFLSGDAFWIHRWRESHQANATEHSDASASTAGFRFNRFDAELGWIPRENFRSAEVNIDSRGARGLQEDPPEKPVGTRRIVILGDSFTFGEGVSDADTYPAALERMLENVRVVNLGALGYGTDQQFLRLRRSAFAYDPDLVILGFFGPNVERNVISFRDAAKPRFELSGVGIRLVGSPVPDPSTEWPSPLPLFRGIAWMETLGGRLLDRTILAPRWEITRRILDAFADECRAHDVPLLLAFYPDKHRSFNPDPSDTEIVVKAWADSRGIPFASVRPAFAALPHSEQAKIFHGHWTPFGNRFVARQLAERLEAMGFPKTSETADEAHPTNAPASEPAALPMLGVPVDGLE